MPTIQQAQNKLTKKDYQSFGGVSRNSIKLNTLEAMLALYAEEFIKTAQDNLNKTNSVASSTLFDSIEFRINYMGTDYNLQLLAADYYDFVNKGVRGVKGNKNNTSPYKFKFINPSKSHREAIRKWITENRSKVRVTDIKKYGATRQETKAIPYAKKLDTLSYIIARSIKRNGLKATGFWDDAFNSTFRDFGQKMAEALGVDLSIDLKNIAQGLNKN